jgi:hypothetical protein
MLNILNDRWGTGDQGTVFSDTIIRGPRRIRVGFPHAILITACCDPRTKYLAGLPSMDVDNFWRTIMNKLMCEEFQKMEDTKKASKQHQNNNPIEPNSNASIQRSNRGMNSLAEITSPSALIGTQSIITARPIVSSSTTTQQENILNAGGDDEEDYSALPPAVAVHDTLDIISDMAGINSMFQINASDDLYNSYDVMTPQQIIEAEIRHFRSLPVQPFQVTTGEFLDPLLWWRETHNYFLC